ncbi:putative choline transport protein [Viridothelium virens]|uniref:Putative choline transport protein n=1 Tax=Viridothelium virens TaxID=1048519 RepID=A0A6A6HDH7_VIRVR|nr:putative choline transport protein [Viridothelium virens]
MDIVNEKKRLEEQDARHSIQDDASRKHSVISRAGEIINASGHRDQLRRQYGLLSICGLALTIDNAWVALGTSISLAIANGGPPGVLYELIVAVIYYGFIAASLAELASALPTAGGVYHWASITPGPRAGRIIGFFTGALNFFGWIFDLASITYIVAELVVQMYVVYHPDLMIQAWHLYIAYVLIIWLAVVATVFANRFLPYLQHFGLFMVIVGGMITIIVVAAMPKQHASHSFVWTDWTNVTGWGSGVAFLTGVLNGAFTIGTPDSVTHIAEELPNPKVDIPKAIAAQIILGGLTSFCYAIALFYGISNLSDVTTSNGSFPVAAIYSQATGSPGATFGLLFIIFLSLIPSLIGTVLTVSRTWWALARDNATPFPATFALVSERLSCPVPATLLTGVLTTALGAITFGSKTAFTDLTGSFVILTTVSYALAIAPNLVTGRKAIPRGPFWMGGLGWVVNGVAVVAIAFFNIMFCFPAALPFDASTMNYNSVILVGVIVLTAFWWLVHGIRKYPGPKLAELYISSGEHL